MHEAIGLLYVAIALVVIPGSIGLAALVASELGLRREQRASSASALAEETP
jgi:hypothetical protein